MTKELLAEAIMFLTSSSKIVHENCECRKVRLGRPGLRSILLLMLSMSILLSLVPLGAMADVVDNSTGNNSTVSPEITIPLIVTVEKTDTPDPVAQGQQLTYNLTIKNIDVLKLVSNVVVTDVLDTNTVFVSASNASAPSVKYSHSGNTVTFNIGSLNAGNTITLGIVTKVSDTAPTTNDPSMNSEDGKKLSLPSTFDICNKVSATYTASFPVVGSVNFNSVDYYQPTNVFEGSSSHHR